MKNIWLKENKIINTITYRLTERMIRVTQENIFCYDCEEDLFDIFVNDIIKIEHFDSLFKEEHKDLNYEGLPVYIERRLPEYELSISMDKDGNCLAYRLIDADEKGLLTFAYDIYYETNNIRDMSNFFFGWAEAYTRFNIQ